MPTVALEHEELGTCFALLDQRVWNR